MIQEDMDDREPESFHREMYLEGLIDGLTFALMYPDKLDELRLFREQVLSAKAKAAWLPALEGLEIIDQF
ncbi:MAG: hypothetical protein M0Z77_08445 [Thermoplasmatales archaeon]|jgi:hypothetical protein|nr:hypothetical protein [Candidatus Thermoplasmatota archaeon]MCL6002562.1 hypothetical protein [Candidatus Thermoplasmatota archaeon]MDA8055656.1 hypothetical protein [Thermoplasmatales archaeon]